MTAARCSLVHRAGHTSPILAGRPVISVRCTAPAAPGTASAECSTSGRELAAPCPDKSALQVQVRSSCTSDYWSVADVHCAAFYPDAGPFWGPLLRLDRVMSMQIGQERDDIQKAGKFVCLLAATPREGRLSRLQSAEEALGPLVVAIVSWLFPPSMRENIGATYPAAGVVGAIVIDTLLDHMPPKRVEANGTVRQARRKGIAYISNLAVAPNERRGGIGLRLVRHAEAEAQAWGCRAVALHVDPDNAAAVQLYKAAGYRFAARQPEWQRWVEGRQSALALMMRVLPRVGRRGLGEHSHC